MLKALNKYLLIDNADNREEARTESGLILGTEDKHLMRYLVGKIHLKGDNVETVDEGDTVYYDKMSSGSYEILLDGKRYVVIQEKDVVIVM